MKQIKEDLAGFFVKHEAVREVKRVNDRAYYKAKDKARVALINEEVKYRSDRDHKIEEFQETVHKIDLAWEEKMRQYYEDQYNQWLEESIEALEELKRIKGKLMLGNNRHIAHVNDRQEQAHELNQHIISRQKEIAEARDFSEHPDPVLLKLAEQLLERIKKSDKARIKAIRDFVEEKTKFNESGWDVLPTNLAEIQTNYTRRCKSINQNMENKAKFIR